MGPPTGGGGGGNKQPPNYLPHQNVGNNQQQYPPRNQQQQHEQQQQTYPQNEPYPQLPYTNIPAPDQAFDQPQQPEQRSVRMRPQPENNRQQHAGYGPMIPGSLIQQPQVIPPPGHEQQNFDEEDGRLGPRVNVNVHYQEAQQQQRQQQIGNATPDIFTAFVVNRMDNDGYDVPQQLRQRQGGNNEREIAKVLQRIGDDMSNHPQLNNMISNMRVTPETVYKTFFSVASEIFADGNINWGRICTLFYFAYKLAIQVLNEMPLVDIVIDWVKRFVFDKLVGWILARGGWKAVHEYFGATPKQLIVVFLAGVAISSMFWYWKK